jgi:hypothetical protein
VAIGRRRIKKLLAHEACVEENVGLRCSVVYSRVAIGRRRIKKLLAYEARAKANLGVHLYLRCQRFSLAYSRVAMRKCRINKVVFFRSTCLRKFGFATPSSDFQVAAYSE